MIQYIPIDPKSDIDFQKIQLQLRAFFKATNDVIETLNDINTLTDVSEIMNNSQQLQGVLTNLYGILSTTQIITPISQDFDTELNRQVDTIPYQENKDNIEYKVPIAQIMLDQLVKDSQSADFDVQFGKMTLLEFFRTLAPVSHYVQQTNVQFYGMPDIVNPEDLSKFVDLTLNYTQFLHQIAVLLPNTPDNLNNRDLKKLQELGHIWSDNVLQQVDNIKIKLYHGAIEDNVMVFIKTIDNQPLDDNTIYTIVNRIGQTLKASVSLGDDSRLPAQQLNDEFMTPIYQKE